MCLFKKKMKKVEEKIEYPRFIPTTPSGIDKFEGGSQKRLSETIAQHFQKNDLLGENALPRIIGIEGEWGSGKSNVVKMLREQLKGKYYFLSMMLGGIKKIYNADQYLNY